jgi:hypothetical protein
MRERDGRTDPVDCLIIITVTSCPVEALVWNKELDCYHLTTCLVERPDGPPPVIAIRLS